ncbi:uncharacterized protein B0H18DRAFT_994854 [Fomitopsis serialis]|uniref:uncharacterized protein n=1 Tax=Fomitopsis serialis TaxID=139415 RepID=UPI00200774D3|nr:uncharacterized protein B0H18DRAFT_994854 [Neoantrodia serialis]KAH9930028.1 hypothetical protein B0H18DRAFT_994854 [Neoantrodia serialis]
MMSSAFVVVFGAGLSTTWRAVRGAREEHRRDRHGRTEASTRHLLLTWCENALTDAKSNVAPGPAASLGQLPQRECAGSNAHTSLIEFVMLRLRTETEQCTAKKQRVRTHRCKRGELERVAVHV